MPLSSLSQPIELRFLQHFGTFPQQMWKYRRPSWSINSSSWSIHLLSTPNLNIHFKIICLWKSGLLEWLHLIIQWAKLYTLFPRKSLLRDSVSKTWDLWTQKRIQATSTFWVLGSILCLRESFRPLSEGRCYFPTVICISRNPSSDESALECQIRVFQLVRPGPRFFQDLFPRSSKLECTEQSNVHDNRKTIGNKSFCWVLMLPCGLWKHPLPAHYPDSLTCQSKLSSKERIFFVLSGVHFHRLFHMKYPNTWDFLMNRNMPTKHPI